MSPYPGTPSWNYDPGRGGGVSADIKIRGGRGAPEIKIPGSGRGTPEIKILGEGRPESSPTHPPYFLKWNSPCQLACTDAVNTFIQAGGEPLMGNGD